MSIIQIYTPGDVEAIKIIPSQAEQRIDRSTDTSLTSSTQMQADEAIARSLQELEFEQAAKSEITCKDCAEENHAIVQALNAERFYSEDSKHPFFAETSAASAVVSEEDDGEVGRRLTHATSISHLPKINGEIPSDDVATVNHQRLLQRLQVYGLKQHEIPGDGNCQFRALSDQFYKTSDHHLYVRQEVIKQLQQDPGSYAGYVPVDFDIYLDKMSKSGEWGDHVTLQAFADAYGIKICLITSFSDSCIIEIFPKRLKSDKVIYLSFWAEVHYNSVYPEDGTVL